MNALDPVPKWTRLLPPWYYLTRLLGASMIVFAILFDETPDRGTIILTGAGLLGLDKVARSEKDK